MEPPGLGGGVSNVAYYLPKALAKRVEITYFPLFRSKKRYLENLLSLYGKFVRKEFEVIHFNYGPTWINGSSVLLKFAKRRCSHTVLNVHGIIGLERKIDPKYFSGGSLPSLAVHMTVESCKAADKVVVNAKHMRAKVAAWYNVDPDKIVVIPNGINLETYNDLGRVRDKVMLDGDPTILFLGCIARIKGIDVLIEAIAKLRSELPNMKLHLVGSGPAMTDSRDLLKKKGIEELAVFHGRVANWKVRSYFESADIYVFPSRSEGFPVTLLEAMSSGIPIIASNIEAFQEVLSNGKDSILFESENSTALARAILSLYHDLDLRKKISQGALETVKKYSWENIAEQYVSLYRCLCE